MPGKYYSSIEPRKESTKSTLFNEFSKLVDKVLNLQEKLNKYVELGYEEVNKPVIDYRCTDEVGALRKEIERLEKLKSDYEIELSLRENIERQKKIDEILSECPEGKMVDMVDESNFYNFPIKDRRWYFHARKKGYTAEMKSSSGKIFSILAPPEQIKEMLKDDKVVWGFNPSTIKYSFI